MSSSPLSGFGMWIWLIDYCEVGQVDKIIETCRQKNISFIAPKAQQGLIKFAANWPKIVDLAKAAHAAGIKVVPWGWIYGRSVVEPYNSIAYYEVEAAKKIIDELDADAYIIDAEAEWKRPGMQVEAVKILSYFKDVSIPILVTSYRYPSMHPEFPWAAWATSFNVARGDGWVPQVYWEQDRTSTAGAIQLVKSYNEYKASSLLNRGQAYIPSPSAYKVNAWAPTAEQLLGFTNMVKELNLPGYLPWNWQQMGPHWSETDSWYKPPVENKIEIPDPTPLPPSDPSIIRKVASKGEVNVRKGPGTSMNILYVLPARVSINVYEIFGSWGKISKNKCEWVYLPLFE